MENNFNTYRHWCRLVKQTISTALNQAELTLLFLLSWEDSTAPPTKSTSDAKNIPSNGHHFLQAGLPVHKRMYNVCRLLALFLICRHLRNFSSHPNEPCRHGSTFDAIKILRCLPTWTHKWCSTDQQSSSQMHCCSGRFSGTMMVMKQQQPKIINSIKEFVTTYLWVCFITLTDRSKGWYWGTKEPPLYRKNFFLNRCRGCLLMLGKVSIPTIETSNITMPRANKSINRWWPIFDVTLETALSLYAYLNLDPFWIVNYNKTYYKIICNLTINGSNRKWT